MLRAFVALCLLLTGLASRSLAQDVAAGPSQETLQAKLLECLLDEERVPERVASVAQVAALGTPDAARALLDALEKLAARTAQVEERSERTRRDYEPYRSAAQASDKDWAIKLRLMKQMEREETVLRGDEQVLGAFTAAAAGWSDRAGVDLLKGGSEKTALAVARRALLPGLLRNPATNAAEIAKRAAADSDPSVRLATLLAYADRKDPALVELAAKVLGDANWAFRQAAARALGSLADLRGVAPLVTAMASGEGELLEEYAAALAKLTGASLGPNPDAWKRWFDDHKAELAAAGGRPANPKGSKNPLAPPVDYYGVQTRSLRLLFLIDCSGSMNEVIGRAGVTTGTRLEGKKIDIAKRMLKAAVSQLHPSTKFNVITFSTDARQLHDALVEATPLVKFQTNERVDELAGRGGTWTYGALRLAFGYGAPGVTPSAPAIDTIFLLSDGAPTEPTFEEAVEAKPMDPQVILDAVKQWNRFRAVKIHTIAIDPRIEKTGGNFVRFMKALAEENGGTYTAVGAE